MGPSGEMAKQKWIGARVDAEQHRRLKSLISDAGGSMDQFIQDAVREKMERGGIATTDVGVLRGLSAEDRVRVQWIADVLRERPDDTLLRDILAAQRGVLQILMRRE